MNLKYITIIYKYLILLKMWTHFPVKRSNAKFVQSPFWYCYHCTFHDVSNLCYFIDLHFITFSSNQSCLTNLWSYYYSWLLFFLYFYYIYLISILSFHKVLIFHCCKKVYHEADLIFVHFFNLFFLANYFLWIFFNS